MNDVPAMVAWILAVPVAVLVAIGWYGVRRLPAPSAPRWRWRALGWAGAAATLGPLTVVPGLVLDEPFGYTGVELLAFGTVILVAITVSLLVPRLVCSALGAGAFARPSH